MKFHYLALRCEWIHCHSRIDALKPAPYAKGFCIDKYSTTSHKPQDLVRNKPSQMLEASQCTAIAPRNTMMRKEFLLLSVFIYFTARIRKANHSNNSKVSTWYRTAENSLSSLRELGRSMSTDAVRDWWQEARGVSKVSSALPALWMGEG